jgi:hypothetical protein
MNYPVDVTIYLEKMSNSLIDSELKESLEVNEEIEDFAKFNEILLEEVEFCALDNYNNVLDPRLDMEQFSDCLRTAIAQYHIIGLQDSGLLEPIFDNEDGVIKYQLTPKGKSIAALNHN